MLEPTACDTARLCPDPTSYCARCDLLVGLDGFHVVTVDRRTGRRSDFLEVVVETPARVVGCAGCGVISHSHGRRAVTLVDVPCFARPVRLVWRKRTWRCAETACPVRSWTEQDPTSLVR